MGRTWHDLKEANESQYDDSFTWNHSPSALHRSWPGGPWECGVSASVFGPQSPDQQWSGEKRETWMKLQTITTHSLHRGKKGITNEKRKKIAYFQLESASNLWQRGVAAGFPGILQQDGNINNYSTLSLLINNCDKWHNNITSNFAIIRELLFIYLAKTQKM